MVDDDMHEEVRIVLKQQRFDMFGEKWIPASEAEDHGDRGAL